MTTKEATSLLTSSAHLLGSGEEARENVAKVIEKSLPNFTDAQIKSSQQLIRKAAGDLQQRPQVAHQMIQDVEKTFRSTSNTQDW